MAILSVQLVLSMVMASILQKLAPLKSFARWLLCSGLVRYLHPSDEELRELALGSMTSNSSTKGKQRRNERRTQNSNNKKHEPFNVPKSIDLQLETVKVQPVDVIQLHYYTDFQWLVDFTLGTLIIYVLTEVYYAVVQPSSELNVSMLWCSMVVIFSFKILITLTSTYFRLQDSGEMILCLTSGFFYLVFAMGILIVDEEILDIELLSAYDNFSTYSREFMELEGVDSQGPMSLTTFRIVLAVTSAFIGALLTFPGLRLAKMHTDALKYNSEEPLMLFLLHTNFFLPLFVASLWIKPYVRDFCVLPRKGAEAYMEVEEFEAMRLTVLVIFCVLRFCLLRTHLQAHLNLAYEKVKILKKEAGKISSIELQRTITRVFYYLCVVALQYVTPLLLLLLFTCMLKTLGNLQWAPFLDLPEFLNRTIRNDSAPNMSSIPEGLVKETAAQFSLKLNNLHKVFNHHWFKGVLSYCCWWINCTWFSSTAFGVMYYSYFQV